MTDVFETAAAGRRPFLVSRRIFLAGLPLALAGCQTARLEQTPLEMPAAVLPRVDPYYAAMYGPLDDEPFPIPALDVSKIEPRWLRQQVAFDGAERAGTVVVDPDQRHLYLVGEGGTAMRYGIGVGRDGFAWNGEATIRRKAAWPTWTPPAEMVKRDPRAAPYANGMPGGLDNPLGARALYLYQGDRDTLYRIHGTTEPWSIGQAVSSGCIRLFNHDIIDLHRRVPVGSRVVVRPSRMA
ncbi:L,D-transpeptidase [Prosthecomicrobium hirschii]|uniref:L,D-transpeptidase n=1 Tax=Prosthecodimorpha hirschii TaxID=665126 RepID=UPI000AA5F4C6|nr:L,D-transpeptidase [Prosthecomicrobium hirschii]MCW1841700.1 L,D-transpeptidase [Prosthecomicrobium hirschii]